MLFNGWLYHRGVANRSDRPRLAQYITMSPAGDPESAGPRIQAWRERRPTPGWPGDPRDREHRLQEPARLTPLGRRLLGLDPWE